MTPARTLTCALTAVLLSGGLRAAGSVDPARGLLGALTGLTAADFERVADGHVVAGTMAATDKREVATYGVVRIRITPEYYIERLTDIAAFKNDRAILGIGAFSSPPTLDDVKRLTLDEGDLRSLRECRVGNCGVQLPSDAIERFQRNVDWQSADAGAQANDLVRRLIVEYVTDYTTTGGGAMWYSDRTEPVQPAREFAALWQSAPGSRLFPALGRHLVDYPLEQSPGVFDLLYWSKEKTGRKAVVNLTHLAIHDPRDSSVEYVVASKHIYGTHYFDASLGLTVLLRDRSAAAPATYLAYVNHSRLDLFGGVFGAMARKIIGSRARSTVAESLARLQQTLEREFAARQTH